MYKEGSWDLSRIAPGDVTKVFKDIEKRTRSLERKRKLLTKSISRKQFMNILQEIESLKEVNSKLGCYVYLQFAEDSTNQKAVALLSQVENFLTKIGNRLLFFSLWFKELPEVQARALIKNSGKYTYYLSSIRKTKPYTLTEKEEKIINIKDVTGVSALNNIYNIFTSQFEYTFQGKKYTQEELSAKAKDPSPKIREGAYRELLSHYHKHKDVLGEIYKNIINDWREENVDIRGYKNPINVRNVRHDLPDKAVDALLKVCEKNQKVFHKYFEIKRKKLGLKKMRRFDLYAPIKTEKQKKILYNDAMEMVLDCYQQFSPKFKACAVGIIEAGHIHSKVQKGKQTGAFCCGVTTKLPPYVLLSYTGTLRSVSTIAHELGHGVHHVLASCQTEFTHSAVLPLAETASIFGEMLLSERILEKYPEKAKELLFFKLDDLYASIIRQSGFIMFEKKAHEMMAQGKTIKEMADVYIADLRKQLGPVEVDDLFAYEWAYIPHIFHTPFYCYAYSFGNLLTLALWETYKEKGEPFAEKIMDMLAKGSSESPVAITRAVGVDITSEAFWQKGFDVIKNMIRKIDE